MTGFDPAWHNWTPTITHFLPSFLLTIWAWLVATDHCVMVPGEPGDTDPYPTQILSGPGGGGYPFLVVRLEPESFFPPEYVLVKSRRRNKTRGNYIIGSWANGKTRAMRAAQREYECDSELGHGIHEIMEHGSQSKHDRWETRGARCSQRERQGNGESFYKHRNIDMDLGQEEEIQSR